MVCSGFLIKNDAQEKSGWKLTSRWKAWVGWIKDWLGVIQEPASARIDGLAWLACNSHGIKALDLKTAFEGLYIYVIAKSEVYCFQQLHLWSLQWPTTNCWDYCYKCLHQGSWSGLFNRSHTWKLPDVSISGIRKQISTPPTRASHSWDIPTAGHWLWSAKVDVNTA